MNVYGFHNPDEIDTWEKDPDDNVYRGWNAGNAEFSWLRSSYNVDYDATYVNEEGERKPIYWILYPASTDAVGDRQTHSYKYIIEAAQKEIDEEIPARIAGSKDYWDNIYMKGVKEDVAAAMAVVNTYKGYEAGYQKWVEDRIAAEQARNKAQMDEFDAREAERAALANYDAKKLIADEGMWVYDEKWQVYTEIYGNKTPSNKTRKDNFTFVPLTKAIEKLEGETEDYYKAEKALYDLAKTAWDTAVADKDISLNDVKSILEAIEAKKADYDDNITELNLVKKLLQKTLEYGKLALEVFVQAYDEEIEELDEKIDVYSAIANMYKTIMNYYLGIVEEAVIEEPVEVEGEEE